MPVIIFSSIAAAILLLLNKKSATVTSKGTASASTPVYLQSTDYLQSPEPTGASMPNPTSQPVTHVSTLGAHFSASTKSGIGTQLINRAPANPMIQNRINFPVNAGTRVGFVKIAPVHLPPLQHLGSVGSSLTRGGRYFRSML